MEDKEAIKVFMEMLTKYELTDNEKEAVKEAIGIMSWTKLIEGYKERKKQARDRKMVDDSNESTLEL